MSINTNQLVAELEKNLGEKPYFTGKNLVDLGLFGSATALNKALKRGDIPTIKISTKRTVVPKSAVLDYFRRNLAEITA